MKILGVNNITKRFGGLEALKNVTFEVNKGEIYGLIGPNGSGKTTLFNVICGFYVPDSGKIKFEGKDITRLRPDQICRLGLGRCFQIVKPFLSMTVKQNVMTGAIFGARRSGDVEKIVEDTLKFMELYKIKDRPTLDLTLADKKTVELARALATGPKLLLLDEVAAGLTHAEIDRRINLIKKIHDIGVTILIVEHVMRFIVGLCSKVTVLNFGEKIAEGNPKEILRDDNVIKAYLGEETYA